MTNAFSISDVFLDARTPLAPKNAVAAIIVNDQDEVLLQLRDNKEEIFFPNHWGCFGGAIEENESPNETLLRELQEELTAGFEDAHITPFIRIAFNPKPTSQQDIQRYFYIVHIAAHTVDALSIGEGQEFRFFKRRHVLELPNVTPYDKFALWLYFNQSRIVEE